MHKRNMHLGILCTQEHSFHIFDNFQIETNQINSYDKLQDRLISTGKLDAGGSVLMIEHMERTGKIKKTKEYNAYRIGNSVTTKEEE
jgi:hypothetical protein